MTAILIVAFVFAAGAVAAVVLPFFLGRGGRLAAAASVNDPVQLAGIQKAIVRRFVAEETANRRGDLSAREWHRRQAYLRHRYIDVTRRLDFLRRAGGKAITGLALIVCSQISPGSANCTAAVTIGQRHAIMLRGGIEQVVGHYFFTIENDSKQAAEFETSVMLPGDALDVRPREGLQADDVVAGTNGGLVIKKSVPPGVNLVSFDFVVSGQGGAAEIRLVAPYEIRELQVLTGRSSQLSIAADSLRELSGAGQGGQWVLREPMMAGQVLAISVQGIAEGRQRLWLLGLSIAGVLVGVGGGLAWWSRPSGDHVSHRGTDQELLDEEVVGT